VATLHYGATLQSGIVNLVRHEHVTIAVIGLHQGRLDDLHTCGHRWLRFQTPQLLAPHRKSHAAEVLFAQLYCDKLFAQLANLEIAAVAFQHELLEASNWPETFFDGRRFPGGVPRVLVS
jgi:hypothetical protein